MSARLGMPDMSARLLCRLGWHDDMVLGYGGAGWRLVRCVRCGKEDIA